MRTSLDTLSCMQGASEVFLDRLENVVHDLPVRRDALVWMGR